MKMMTYADPDSYAGVRCPVLADSTTDSQLERKNKSPLHNIIPSHGETPRWIHETVGIPHEMSVFLQAQGASKVTHV